MTEGTAEKHSIEGAFTLDGADESTEGEPTDHSQSAEDAEETFNWVDSTSVKEPVEDGSQPAVEDESESVETDEPTPVDADDPASTDAPSASTTTQPTAEEAGAGQTAEPAQPAVDDTSPDRSQSPTTAGSTEESSGVFSRLRSTVGGLF